RRDACAVERYLRDRAGLQAHGALPGQRVDAGGVGVGEKARDAGRSGSAGAGEHIVEVGDAGVGDPGLGAAHDVVVAVAYGLGGEVGGVRTAAGFGQAVGTEQVAAEHAGQQLGALLVGAVG